MGEPIKFDGLPKKAKIGEELKFRVLVNRKEIELIVDVLVSLSYIPRKSDAYDQFGVITDSTSLASGGRTVMSSDDAAEFSFLLKEEQRTANYGTGAAGSKHQTLGTKLFDGGRILIIARMGNSRITEEVTLEK